MSEPLSMGEVARILLGVQRCDVSLDDVYRLVESHERLRAASRGEAFAGLPVVRAEPPPSRPPTSTPLRYQGNPYKGPRNCSICGKPGHNRVTCTWADE